MSSEDAPLARRMRRPTWRDPRLGVGVLLVAGSVLLGTWAVRDAAATEQVYVARQTLTPGSPLDQHTLTVAEARPPGDVYLGVRDPLGPDAVVTRVVTAGEMVPRAAVGHPDDVEARPIVVPVGTALPAGLGPGAVVDLWFTPAAGITPAAGPEPQLLVGGLVLAGVVEQESVFVTGQQASVELLVPTAQVADVLAALAQDGELVVVPSAPGSSEATEVAG